MNLIVFMLSMQLIGAGEYLRTVGRNGECEFPVVGERLVMGPVPFTRYLMALPVPGC